MPKTLQAGDPVHIVHIYAQTQWHSPAAISGSAAGLARLKDAIERALATGSGRAEAMTDDGEGYGIAVIREGPETMEEWSGRESDRGLPYTDETAAVAPSSSFWDRVSRTIGLAG